MTLTFVICAITLYKVREVDRSTRALAVYSSSIRQEVDTIFRQIQALLALEKKLGLREALPTMRGWAASPDFLLYMAREIERRMPKNVLECGSGTSTIVAARVLQMNGSGHLYSLEHDPTYAGKTRALLFQYGLTEWATIIDAPLDTQQTITPWYSDNLLPRAVANVEILIVDGPPSAVAPLARYPALPRLVGRMADNALVIVDDAARNDEHKMLLRWAEEFPEFTQSEVACEKGCALLIRHRT